ncbi:hydroxymethylbilane synthase [Arenibacter sp. GZD96]|uniref:hydroxymethylbilane synthase n=1 Tax=Aurantibrevibacter litoralis TaxID=3106030 RepID=UPI002AFF9AFE|nr:hydroxymethylbilane synthase [Arenibacter sp. GZD-96]MEA1785708.1 hydroxymethylbilane synthase [Arenibacter sp. GZD-96]
MSKVIRIGTRDSQLALWQANTVKSLLQNQGYSAQLMPVKSDGDLILDKPLYELGITGIFTKTLDVAMLRGDIDIAVHSMKDVPTVLPRGMVQAAVLPRANVVDILVHKGLEFLQTKGTIATGSLRRKAQWLHKYPQHKVDDLRGNVNTRMQKLKDNAWNGAIFAAAGLERIQLTPQNHIVLDWMIPAPAQGAMVVVAMEKDSYAKEALIALNHPPTALCTTIEREFLRTLEGGCSAPIGALATIIGGQLHFKGCLCSLDGSQKLEIEKSSALDEAEGFGNRCAQEILQQGGREVLKGIKKALA